MKQNALKFVNHVFLVAAFILLIISILSYIRINEQAKASNLVSNTQLIKFKLNDAFLHLVKTETAQRGYVLTGDNNFWLDYHSAKNQIPKLLKELETSFINSKEQTAHLKHASYLFNTTLQHLQATIHVSPELSREGLNTLLMKGEYLTDELSDVIDKMISNEDHLLAHRIALKKQQERRTSFFLLLFSAFSIATLLYSYFKLKKETVVNTVLEQKVVERTNALNEANEALQHQNIDLKKKNEELSSFNFIANHDLKEPLRKIELFTNKLVVLNEGLSSESKTLLEKTTGCVKRMRSLLDDILIYTMTDINSGFEITDLNKTLEASIEFLRSTIDEKGASIEMNPLPFVKADPQQMEQLFTNLLANSLKYSKKNEKPLIKIFAAEENTGEGAYWKIAVSDNGIGFNEAYSEKIFQMFKRLHSTYDYPGTGMGLTICKKIVENHKGTITANSSKDDGAVFTIRLPKFPEHEEAFNQTNSQHEISLSM